MRETLEKTCKEFIENRDTIKGLFNWDSPYIIAVCAAELCGKSSVADAEKLKSCKKLVDSKTGIFSNFRGNVKLPIISLLAEDDHSEQKLDKAMKIYEILKQYFWGSQYLTLVATILADMIDVAKADDYAKRGKKLYDLMKNEHPFLTAGEDSVFAVLMAFSEKEDRELIVEMEECYKLMKTRFSNSNAMQSLSHVLAMASGDSREKCNRVLSLYQKLNMAGKKYGKYYELSVLGAMALLTSDVDNMVEDIIEVDSFLEKQKGYGILGIDKKTRLMHAVMLTSCDYAKQMEHVAVHKETEQGMISAAAMSGTLAMIAAQQAAMCAVIAASTAASAANN